MASVTRGRTSRRTIRQFRHRRTGFLELDEAQHGGAGLVLEAALASGVERLYLVGRRPGGEGAGTDGLRRWAATGLPPGWVEADRGHYLEADYPVLRYRGPEGAVLEVLRAAQWFGEGDYTSDEALEAWRLLGDELGRDFPHAELLGSPAATGRELFQQTIPYGREWPVLSEEHQAMVRADAGQGRIQLLGRAAPSIAGVHVYDGRLFYAALCWGLPAGPAELVRCGEYLGQRRARYRARVRIPRDWPDRCRCGAPGHPGIGILPHREADEGGWHYSAEPGRVLEGVWDGAELHVALAHGWAVRPSEALLFTPYKSAGPLDGWAKRLIACRERIDRLPQLERPANARVLARHAIRNLILHAIGAFVGGSHRVTHSLPVERAGEVPADARDLRVEADRIVWAVHEPTSQPGLAHPEWSAAIWARGRARLLDGPPASGDDRRTGALHWPAADVLAFRTDALYLTTDPHWRDDGHAGRLRHTGHTPGPIPTPRTAAQLLEVTR